MTTSNAVAVVSKGEVDAIQLAVTPPSDGEVLIKNEYAGVTISDVYFADLGILTPTFPAVLGTTVSGTIIQVGQGVTDLKVGDRVAAVCVHGQKSKGLQEYSTVPRFICARVSYLTYSALCFEH